MIRFGYYDIGYVRPFLGNDQSKCQVLGHLTGQLVNLISTSGLMVNGSNKSTLFASHPSITAGLSTPLKSMSGLASV